MLFKDRLKYFLWKITMLPSQGSKIQGWERVAVFSSSTEVLLLLWRRRISNLSIICLFTDGTTKIIWTRCELFFAKTTNFHFPECEKLRTDNNADQQLELLPLFQHWSWSQSLELWKPTGATQFPSNECIKMCHNASSTKISCQGWRWTRWRQPWVWRGGHRPVHCRGEADPNIYIMMKCLSVTKMITSELTTRGAKRDAC